MSSNSFYLYMAEKAGYLNTRESRLNRAAAEIATFPGNLSENDFMRILDHNDLNDLSYKEYRRITKKK